jgi:hypothetical protein
LKQTGAAFRNDTGAQGGLNVAGEDFRAAAARDPASDGHAPSRGDDPRVDLKELIRIISGAAR